MKKTETMYDCFLSQPECLTLIFQNKKRLFSDFVDFYAGHKTGRVYLIGSGTSYHACAAAAPYMEQVLGIEVTVSSPTATVNIYEKSAMAVAVSQSGRSTNTLTAVARLKEAGIPVVTLTDPIDTPVAKAGDLPVLLSACDEQIGPKTRGYTATLLSLVLMALEVKSDTYVYYARDLEALCQIIEQYPSYINVCENFFEKHMESIKKARHYLFVGKGVSGKAADECALKVLETLCYPASGYEFEEFLHGPVFCADETMAVFFYLPEQNDVDYPRIIKAAEIMRRATENVYIVSRGEEIAGYKTLCLPYTNTLCFSAFVDVLIGQLISARLPGIMGRERHPAVRGIAKEMDTKL